jgi:hypothetical protein
VFILGLKKNGSEIDEEILLHLRQIYQKMNYEKDAIAITELIEVLRNKSGLSKEELKSLAISHKDNREFLVYCLYYMEHNGFEKESFEIRKLLKKRDKDRQTEEYADIFPLFIGEEGEVH